MKIAQFASLWTMTGYPSVAKEWSLRRKFRAIAEAGFSGVAGSLQPEYRGYAEEYGLEHLLGFISTNEPDTYAADLRAQKEGGAVQINVQLDDHDTPPAIAVKHWIALEREAERIGGLVPSLEVHRDTCTETPEKTYEIAERYEKLTGQPIRLNFDYSHFAVVKHLKPINYIERLLDHPALVQHCTQVHLRPFNGHHAQVPVTFRGALSPEIKSYFPFVCRFFEIWKEAPSNQGKTLFVCPEMGAYAPDGGGYNISGLRHAWPEAQVLRPEFDRLWKKA